MTPTRSSTLARIAGSLDWRNAMGVVDILRGPPAEAKGLDAHGRLRSGRLKGLSMPMAIWVLSWPILVESALNALVGLTDTVLSSQIGSGSEDGLGALGVSAVDAVDAISAASYIMWFIGLTFMALGMGATSLISRSVGRGRMGVAGAAMAQCLLLGAILAAAVGALVAISTTWIPGFMGLSEPGAKAFRYYMLVIAAGTPLAGLLFGGIACLRGAGDSVRPLWAMIARNVVNIVMSWALSGIDLPGLANPFSFDLGIVGIAIGTVAGDAVGALMILGYCFAGASGVKLRVRRLRPHWHTIRRLVRLGLPNYFETLGMWVGNFAIVFFVAQLSVAGAAKDSLRTLAESTPGQSAGLLGSHMWAIRIEAISFLPGFAMGIAAATLAGQYLGAGSPRHAIRGVLACAGLASLLMGTLGVLMFLFPTQITNVLTPVPEHREVVPTLLMICGVVQIPFALAIVFRQALRGVGDVRVVMGLTWFTTYGIRLPAAYLVSGVRLPLPDVLGGGELLNPMGEFLDWEPSLARLWLALCSELIIRGIVFAVRFGQGTWTKIRV
ncbi:MAG: MATE family efflux transporter [Phycisphaerales bacterium]|jgi:Na+-driven multidrug efflux pump